MALTLHGYINTTKMCAENVDAMNCAGVYASGDVDNGTIVVLSAMNTVPSGTNQGYIEGYEYTVTLATQNQAGDVWVVASPEVGTTIDQQILSDPRYFYNEAGRPMSLKYLVDGVDCIEVTKECFTGPTLPDGKTNKYATIAANGQLTAAASAPSGTVGVGYFTVEGLHSVTIGAVEVPTVVLRYHRVATA